MGHPTDQKEKDELIRYFTALHALPCKKPGEHGKDGFKPGH